jgi:hypothetical protein
MGLIIRSAREHRWQYTKVEQDPGGLRCAKPKLR